MIFVRVLAVMCRYYYQNTTQVSPDEVVYIDDVRLFNDIPINLGIKSIRHVDWHSTSAALADMGLLVENNKLVNA